MSPEERIEDDAGSAATKARYWMVMVVDQFYARDSIGRWIASGDPSGVPEVALGRAS